jgi:hypothetical protein
MILAVNMKKNESKNKKRGLRVILPFVIIVISIFLIAVLLSWSGINRFFARLGFGPPIKITVVQKEFTYTIPSSQLVAGKVINYYSSANDTSGNENTTIIKSFKVIYPENITHIHIENETNYPTGTIKHGHQLYVSFNITNERASGVTRRYIVQLVDPDGKITQSINSNRMTVSSGQEEENDVSFTAEKIGTYKAQVFIWTDWASQSGFPIASSEIKAFNSV